MRALAIIAVAGRTHLVGRLLAIAVATVAALLACERPAPPPTPPPVDPRIDLGASPAVDDSSEDAQTRFARALTGHRAKTYVADLDEIRQRGVLRVLTRNNSTSYFLYKGVEAGFDYEVAKWIAKEMGVRLEMVVAPTRRELVPWLLDGKGDVIIAGYSPESARAARVRFTRPYIETSWVVVTKGGKRAPTLARAADLAGLDLLVRPSSGAMKRLRALDVPGLTLRGAVETEESEDLIDAVSEGLAAACVVEERIARVELMHRRDLRIAFSFPGEVVAALAVRKEDENLARFLDAFLEQNRKGVEWNLAWRRYHSWRDETRAVRNDDLRADRDGRITPWDDTFKRAAREFEIDWRLAAAQAYQESRFDPDARSPFGAVGVMQFLPATAKELGCGDPEDPRHAIPCAARYLSKLMQRYSDDGVALKDRVRFALAAYNSGPAHVDDARVLAQEQQLDANRWFGNVETAMLLLSRPKYYERAKHGFARGDETVRYVSEIQTRYDAYVALTTSTPVVTK